MGMAASQARFLGLTARKSNVEYQGQQVNQQRTTLSNESANLYNQMMELKVPTPPSTSDYYKTLYILEDSAGSYGNSDYQISNLTKTYNAENEYSVTLITNKEYRKRDNESYKVGEISGQHFEELQQNLGVYTGSTKVKSITTIPLIDTSVNSTIKIVYDDSSTDAYTGENGSLSINQYQVYKAPANRNLDGYDECCTDKSQEYYFYQDRAGKNHFLTKAQLDEMVSGKATNKSFDIATTYTYTKELATQVIATLETSTTGRYSSIIISDNERNSHVSNDLKGKTFTINTVQEMNQAAYDDAYNDYEYNKTMYEKTISDINAQTEIIQREDQQLELRLQQLNTEQNAIKTEMDSVQQVIKDNVEKTFKVFA